MDDFHVHVITAQSWLLVEYILISIDNTLHFCFCLNHYEDKGILLLLDGSIAIAASRVLSRLPHETTHSPFLWHLTVVILQSHKHISASFHPSGDGSKKHGYPYVPCLRWFQCRLHSILRPPCILWVRKMRVLTASAHFGATVGECCTS